MSSLAMVVRCDNGGLGSMTWEAWRHLQPARTLVVRASGPGCGTPRPDRFDNGDVRATTYIPTSTDATWLIDGATAVYTAETWYGNAVPSAARRHQVPMFLHVMPEYWHRDLPGVRLAPTGWQAPPGSQILPVPVARDRFPRRHIDGVDTLYHVGSPDGHDRNGTKLLVAALEELRRPCRVLIRQPGRRMRDGGRHEVIGRAHVEWLPHHDGPYWEAWPDDTQALLMLRRYAGLSLPMQEAAALGLPIVTLDRPPEADWLPTEARVPAKIAGQVRTWRSCRVDLWDATPAAVAETIDTLTANPGLAVRLAAHSDTWAESLDWSRWVDTYRDILQ